MSPGSNASSAVCAHHDYTIIGGRGKERTGIDRVFIKGPPKTNHYRGPAPRAWRGRSDRPATLPADPWVFRSPKDLEGNQGPLLRNLDPVILRLHSEYALNEVTNLHLRNRDTSRTLRMTDDVAPSFLHTEWRSAPWINSQGQASLIRHFHRKRYTPWSRDRREPFGRDGAPRHVLWSERGGLPASHYASSFENVQKALERVALAALRADLSTNRLPCRPASAPDLAP